MHAQLNLHLIFNRGEAYFTGAATSTIAQFRLILHHIGFLLKHNG
jgi:hypothetical protein